MKTIRQQRVGDMLFEELSIMIAHELSDPRLTHVDVTSVGISRDLRNAKVHVFHRDEETEQREVLNALQSALPYIRRQVAQRCGLRSTPEFAFYYDDTPEKAARIDELLKEIAQDRGDLPEDSDLPEDAEKTEEPASGSPETE